ncbi:hypothetical protein ACRQ5Q_15000 [Bradyrhizobium sp. PMVTL-01]|uniref:hypothetical protein n=1 Tax=Bradyrhizobium sp. PMVTL-01 TaxID=3434999 RepID=UPI003F6E989E
MWFRFSKPDYFYLGRYRLLDASDMSPFNRGVSIGFGFFVFHARWNEGRSESHEGLHYPDKPRFDCLINGQRISLPEIASYELICSLAGQPQATVTYRSKDGLRHGMMGLGDKVLTSYGMVFSAVTTGAA